MNKTAKDLERAAREARYQYATGVISYEKMVAIAQAYIDHCNTVAKRIAKEYGMKPKIMSVKAWLR